MGNFLTYLISVLGRKPVEKKEIKQARDDLAVFLLRQYRKKKQKDL